MAKQQPIGRVELEVLRFVAENHPARARDVAEHMAKASGQARTTILTVLERLKTKGFLKRRKIDGVYHYAPKTSKSEVIQKMIGEFVGDVLKGSVSPFVAYLSQTDDLSDEEVEELRSLVDKLDSRRQRNDR